MPESFEIEYGAQALDAGLESLEQLAARIESLGAEVRRLRQLAAYDSHADRNRLGRIENRLWRAMREVRV
jgi:hypothetical protein